MSLNEEEAAHQLNVMSKTSSEHYMCNICKRVFDQKKDLLVHTYVHKANPRYDCTECGKNFTKKASFDRHVNAHQKGKKNAIRCKICGIQCANRSELEEHHRQSHLEEKRFSCDICKAEFSWEDNLRRHKRNHLVDNYQCELCSKVFMDTISLRTHMRNHKLRDHEITSEKKFLCEKCNRSFQYDFSYQAHLRSHQLDVASNVSSAKNTTQNEGRKSGVVNQAEKNEVTNSQKQKLSDTLLEHAKLIPALKTSSKSKPYPNSVGLTYEETISASVKILQNSANRKEKESTLKLDTTVCKAKRNVTKPDKQKSTKTRFGNLNMISDTPFQCHLCGKSYRWEVSLQIHIKEHTDGAPTLSARELRRRRKFLVEDQMTKSGQWKVLKKLYSPKKSRLVKRKAGSDDEDSDDASQSAKASPSKQPKHSDHMPKTYTSLRTRQSTHTNSTVTSTRTPINSQSVTSDVSTSHVTTKTDVAPHVSVVSDRESSHVLGDFEMSFSSQSSVDREFHFDSSHIQQVLVSSDDNQSVMNDASESVSLEQEQVQRHDMEQLREQPKQIRHGLKQIHRQPRRRSPTTTRAECTGLRLSRAEPVSEPCVSTTATVTTVPLQADHVQIVDDSEYEDVKLRTVKPSSTCVDKHLHARDVEQITTHVDPCVERVQQRISHVIDTYTESVESRSTRVDRHASDVRIEHSDAARFNTFQPIVANIIHDDKTIEQVSVVECIKLCSPPVKLDQTDRVGAQAKSSYNSFTAGDQDADSHTSSLNSNVFAAENGVLYTDLSHAIRGTSSFEEISQASMQRPAAPVPCMAPIQGHGHLHEMDSSRTGAIDVARRVIEAGVHVHQLPVPAAGVLGPGVHEPMPVDGVLESGVHQPVPVDGVLESGVHQPVPVAANIAQHAEVLTERLNSESHGVGAVMDSDVSRVNTTYQHCFVPFGGGGGMLEALQSNVLIAASGTPVDTAAELESVNYQQPTASVSDSAHVCHDHVQPAVGGVSTASLRTLHVTTTPSVESLDVSSHSAVGRPLHRTVTHNGAANNTTQFAPAPHDRSVHYTSFNKIQISTDFSNRETLHQNVSGAGYDSASSLPLDVVCKAVNHDTASSLAVKSNDVSGLFIQVQEAHRQQNQYDVQHQNQHDVQQQNQHGVQQQNQHDVQHQNQHDVQQQNQHDVQQQNQHGVQHQNQYDVQQQNQHDVQHQNQHDVQQDQLRVQKQGQQQLEQQHKQLQHEQLQQQQQEVLQMQQKQQQQNLLKEQQKQQDQLIEQQRQHDQLKDQLQLQQEQLRNEQQRQRQGQQQEELQLQYRKQQQQEAELQQIHLQLQRDLVVHEASKLPTSDVRSTNVNASMQGSQRVEVLEAAGDAATLRMPAASTVRSPARQSSSKVKKKKSRQLQLLPAATQSTVVLAPMPAFPSQGNHIIVQPAPQNAPIQIVNTDGKVQPIQTVGGVQLFANAGNLQSVQAPPPALQLVPMTADGVSVIGAQQPTANGYQLVQTASGLQVVPLPVPNIQPFTGTLPAMISGYQSAAAAQNLAPISMINMNITNNVQTPMQTFQSNVNTGAGSYPLLPNTLTSPLTATNLVPAQQLMHCVNPNGEVVTVTPLFQMPVAADQSSTAVQSNLLTANVGSSSQSLTVNPGFMPVPLNSNAAPANMWPTFSYTPLSMNSAQHAAHAESPLNMVCKNNLLTSLELNREEEDEEKIDVIHT